MRGCLLSQLAHLEIHTPRPQESLDFYTHVLGLDEVDRDGQSVYLRAWGEWLQYSLVLTEGPQPELVHVGWRAAGADELEAASVRLASAGVGEGWHDDSNGHGPAYRYRGPGGQLHEIFWEAERYVAPPDRRSTFPGRPQRYVPRGAMVRQLDHVTMPTPEPMADARWYAETLGYRFMEYTVIPGTNEAFFAQVTNNEQAHTMALLKDSSGIGGRVHHFAYWLDQAVDVLRAAEIILETGASLEFGPGKHGHGENNYLYLREPSGMRIELFSGGYRNYLPDWEPVCWDPSQGSADIYRTTPAPESMMELFPSGEGEQRFYQVTEGESFNPYGVTGVS